MAFTVRWDFPLATFRLTRRIVWQAQYFVTVWPGREELKVSSFLGAQVNADRFAWHLQYAGTFLWLLSGWRVELCGRHNTLWRSDLGGRNWKCLVCAGAQVNAARFAWHLQYAGTFDWLLEAWRVELCGRRNALWRSDLGGRNWKCLAF